MEVSPMTERIATEEAINAAADQIARSGTGLEPSVRMVRVLIGGGNPKTILDGLKLWRQKREAAIDAIPPLTEETLRRINIEIQMRVEEGAAEAKKALEDAERERDEIAADAGVQHEENKQLRDEIEGLKRSLSERDGSIRSLQDENGTLRSQVDEIRTELDTARIERAEAVLKLEKYPDLETELAQVKTAFTQIETEKKDLEMVLDDYKARIDSLTAALQKMAHIEGEAKNLKQTLADYKTREETTQSQLAGFQKFATDTQRMAGEAQQKQADETRRLLDAMKTKFDADLEAAKGAFERALAELTAEYESKIQTAATERANRTRDIAASNNANMRKRRGMLWKTKN
jgi:chromosome segregation ATPase